MSKCYLIATSKPWHVGLCEDLKAKTGQSFEFISDPRDLTLKSLDRLNPRYIFFPHWSHHIPVEIFEKFECVIFHMTDLPYGRGGSPLQNLIIRGIYQTQLTALKCTNEVDAGPVYLKRPLSLHGSAEEIYLRASKLIESMIIEIIAKNPKTEVQLGDPVYFKRRTPEQGDLCNANSLEQTFDLIRMLDAYGYPRAFIKIGNLRLEFTRASLRTDHISADVRITFIDNDVEHTK